MNQQLASADELFLVVDENDQPLDPLPRKLVHGHGAWHRVAHVWLVSDHLILCQQRSLNKEFNPGFWEPFFGGHMHPNETYEQAAMRELTEELGISVTVDRLHFWKVYQYFHPQNLNNEFMGIFVVNIDRNQKVVFEDHEVARVVWKPVATIEKALTDRKPNWTSIGYELNLLKSLHTA